MYDTSGSGPRSSERRRRRIEHRRQPRQRFLAGDAVGMETVLALERRDARGERLIPAARQIRRRAIERAELAPEPRHVRALDRRTDRRQSDTRRLPEHDEAAVPVTL